jgi:predicted short-subunit dehydrogenase-like oxidoreductase (DUF2520 family)
MSPLATLNIIGCGRLGKTLGCLWRQKKILHVQDITTRSLASARASADFIGGGTACSLESLRPADFTMISTNDGSIADCAKRLAVTGILRPGDIVFHCSGAHGSEILSAVRRRKALIASVHPIKSFAEPASAAASFPGTFCGVEGDSAAAAQLNLLFGKIGGIPFPLRSETKTLYHAAMTMSANYLVTLLQLSVDTLQQAGLSSATASKIIEPLVRNTVDNIFSLGPAEALTGPVSRRDEAIVRRHLEALQSWQPETAELYRILGRQTLKLARTLSDAAPEQERAMNAVLKAKDNE